ncbi:MAG: matrixin family metalloprotease [Bryobacteraceae bacterium]
MRGARLTGLLVVLFLIATTNSAAQPVLHLKGGRRPAGERLNRRNLGRRHWIVQFPSAPNPGQLAELRRRGVRILSYVPDFGLSVSAADDTDFAGLDLHWIGGVAKEDKFSSLLDSLQGGDEVQFVIVEFYPDVDMNDARSIVVDLQLQIQESSDLLDHHLLVSGTSDQIASLGDWDEVSYVFPASDDLVQGVPVHACAGALTDQGSLGQSILRVGDGWDGPGQNGADLNYAFVNKTPKLPPDGLTAEVARAFAEWAKHAKLTFTQTSDPNAGRTIAVMFGARSHGDGFPFDGPGGILAHTFYPYPVNPEPIAGDMHFDADENWKIGADVDLFSVALHETGHALGLGHSDTPGAVMYPYYRLSSALTSQDIGAILAMYAAQDGSPAATIPLTVAVQETNLTTTDGTTILHGTTAGGSGRIVVSWTSDHGFSGTASGAQTWTAGPIALSIGINTITITAIDASHTQVFHTIVAVRQAVASGQPISSPQIDITAPAAGGIFSTTVANVSLSGTASAPSGIMRVIWSNSRGGNGQGSGATNWSTGSVSLQTGLSTITVTAIAQNGLSASRTLQVSYVLPGGAGTSPPSLTIVSPALTTVSTSGSSIAVSGTARDNNGISGVTWTNSTGGSGNASGTSNWSIGAIPLLVGTNTITVRATNVGGVAAWRSIVVTRQ